MKVTVEKVGKRIYLRCGWAPDLPERLKAMGGRWSPKSKSWTYPLDIEYCRKFRGEFGGDLNIGPELWAWAQNERQRETQLHAAGSIRDMDVMAGITLERIREQAPIMWDAMLNRPFQPVASLYCAEAGQSLLADQPGVGKTIESLGALIEAGISGRVLVMAPLKSTRAVWEPEVHRWLADYKHGYSVTRVSGTNGKKLEGLLAQHAAAVEENPDGLHFLIANAEMARVDHKGMVCPTRTCDGYQDWCPNFDTHKGGKPPKHDWLFHTKGPRGGKRKMLWDAIIADETHQWLINTRGKSASQVGYGMAHLATTERNFRIAMTGTPLKGKKHNLFGTLNWLRPDVYASKWRWAGDYFLVNEGEYSKTIGDLAETRKDAFFRSLNSIMIRRTKKELRDANPAWMPPEKRYHDVWVEMDGKQRKAYAAMEKSAEVELESGRLEANGILAEMTRLKQFASCSGDMVDGKFKPMLPSCKFDWLLEFLEERGIERKEHHSHRYGPLSDEVQKVVVATPFTSMIDVWSEEFTRLGIRHTSITGKTKDALKEMTLFQGDPNYRVCFINTKAGGVSITLDAADDVVLLGETWVPDEQEQVEDRVHRASNVEHQVDVWYVRTSGTIEEGIAHLNMAKAESNHVVLDAQRGLAFARTLTKKGKRK
jgi:SNF2 family DNA or RNA helicase